MFRLGRSFYRGWYHSPPAKPLIRVPVGSHGFKFGLHLTLKVSDGFKCPIFSTILLSVNVEQIQEQFVDLVIAFVKVEGYKVSSFPASVTFICTYCVSL